ncbi:OmpA family protein, partial [Rhodonellum sp.]
KFISFKASGFFLLAFSLFSNGHAQQIEPLKVLNSPYDEQHPVFSLQDELFFSVGFHPQNIGGPTDSGDIWMGKKNESGQWEKPIRINGLSTGGNDVVVGFTDALSILVYHHGNGKKQGIHQYSRFGSSWNYVRQLDMGNFKNSGSHFSGRLSKSGEVMVMSMASFGSYGNEDIYVSIKLSDNKWSSPVNLGPKINTQNQEMTPYLSEDGQTLYFSSNSSEKNRGRDIYYSHRIGEGWDNWAAPKPLVLANSKGSEMGYTKMASDDKMAVFTSTQNSAGFGDLMVINFEEFEKPAALAEIFPEVKTVVTQEEIVEEKIIEKIVEAEPDSVLNNVTLGKVVETKALVIEKNPSTKLDSISIPEKPITKMGIIKILDINTLEQIDYSITLINVRGLKKVLMKQDEIREWMEDASWNNVLVTSKGYLPQEFEMAEWKMLSDEPVLMRPAKPGVNIVLDNIQFNRGTSEFADAKSIQILDNLVEFLVENPEIKIRLEGHTDSAGDPMLNKELSLSRASKIRGYFTLHGVNFERVRVSGWGGTRPVASNETEEGRMRNRRVEMLIEK